MNNKSNIIKIFFMMLVIILTTVILNKYIPLRLISNNEGSSLLKEVVVNKKESLFKSLKLNKDITIRAVGDIIVHDEQIKSAYNEGDKSYDFKDNFSYIKNYLEEADLTYASLEGTYTGEEEGGYSGYPVYNSPESMLEAIKGAGIDLISINSEHILDKGKIGLLNTINNVEKNKLDYIGAKKESESKNYVIKNIKGINIGFTSYVFESSQKNGKRTLSNKGIPNEVEGLINTFGYETLDEDIEKIKSTIDDMKSSGAQFIIVGMHWGIEYEKKPSKYQKKIATELNKLGVDLILGSHPHVVQSVEKIKSQEGKETLVVYSMGNFLSNQREETIGKSETAIGIIMEFKIGKNSEGNITVKEYSYIPTWVYKYVDDDSKTKYEIIPTKDVLKSDLAKEKLNEDVLESIKNADKAINEIFNNE